MMDPTEERTRAINEARKRRQRKYRDRRWYLDVDKLESLGIRQFKSSVGDNFIRIVPPPEPGVYFGLELWVHYDVGPNGDAFLCARRMTHGKDRCPVCEQYQHLRDSDVDPAELRRLRPGPPRFLFWIIDYKDRTTQSQGLQLYDAPRTINDGILDYSVNRRTGEVTDISHPKDGQVFVFTRTGEGPTNTRYHAFEVQEAEPVPDEILAKVPRFADILVWPDYEEVREATLGPEGEEEEQLEAGSTVPRAGADVEHENMVPSRDDVAYDEGAPHASVEQPAPRPAPVEQPAPRTRRSAASAQAAEEKQPESLQLRTDALRQRIRDRVGSHGR